ncbi:MAG: hypothetical protein GY906_12265 [bacterium]|nr:hypothetical protein [bacterium]
MTDEQGREIDKEQQRAEMLGMLRHAHCALLIVVSDDGQLRSAYLNLNPIERRGILELLHDTAPRFDAVDEEPDDTTE